MQSPQRNHFRVDRSPLMIIRELPAWCAADARVLDLGSGSGRHAIALAMRGYHVDAIDESPAAIEKLREIAAARELPITGRVARVTSSDIDFGRYTAVVCTFVLHFLTRSEAHELLARARALAAPGTVHALAAFTSQGELCNGSSAQFFFPAAGELAEDYRQSGWRVHRAWEQLCNTIERRADGTPKRNLTSFVIAGA